jgi:hypothetical protein
MPVYTVHEPPPRAADPLPDPERIVFVRDGFYWWAFLLTPFWMARHRLWLVLALYLLVSLVIETALRVAGAGGTAITAVAILISLLAGLEAGSLWRFTLNRRRWRNVGIVSGADAEDAEQRFFETWVRESEVRNAAAPPKRPEMLGYAPAVRSTDTQGIIGLFPEPGTRR